MLQLIFYKCHQLLKVLKTEVTLIFLQMHAHDSCKYYTKVVPMRLVVCWHSSGCFLLASKLNLLFKHAHGELKVYKHPYMSIVTQAVSYFPGGCRPPCPSGLC
ncbi:hypothetical protein XENOCAPTIV_009587 [Xenoophorus captivus]|uniref:Uncharacterized protein n=1 Tax=Xenoophorus captivus TaxID=1517983 RepID=A0ABV0RQ45_9TELE